MAKVYLLLLVSLLLVPLLLQASLLSVQQRVEGNQRQFSYQFYALNRETHFRFSLPQTSIRRNGNLVRRYIPEVGNQQLGRELQQQAREAGPYRVIPGAGGDWQNFQLSNSQVTTSPLNDPLATKQLSQQLQQFALQFQQQQLSEAGYHLLQLPDNRQLINVDHLQIIQHSLADIAPLADSARDQLRTGNERQLIQTLLAWVQQIPPHPAEQREYGRSFIPPLQMLTEHQGDSASKTVLLATLLRSCLPQIKQAILYLPNHTLLALAMPTVADERTVSLQGATYLVVDPAAQHQPELDQKPELGQIERQQLIYVLNQHFAYRLF